MSLTKGERFRKSRLLLMFSIFSSKRQLSDQMKLNKMLLPLCEARLSKNYNLTKKMYSLFLDLNIMSEQVTTFNMSDLFPSKGTSVTQKFKHFSTGSFCKIFMGNAKY